MDEAICIKCSHYLKCDEYCFDCIKNDFYGYRALNPVLPENFKLKAVEMKHLIQKDNGETEERIEMYKLQVGG